MKEFNFCVHFLGANFHCDQVSEERIRKLSFVQYSLLNHALSFPNVQKVVYSTCSIYEEENEQVVDKILVKFESKFKLKKIPLKKKFPGWATEDHRGKPGYNCSRFCLRTDTATDLCSGFFVAIFKRILPDSQEIETISELENDNIVKKKRKKLKSK